MVNKQTERRCQLYNWLFIRNPFAKAVLEQIKMRVSENVTHEASDNCCLPVFIPSLLKVTEHSFPWSRLRFVQSTMNEENLIQLSCEIVLLLFKHKICIFGDIASFPFQLKK